MLKLRIIAVFMALFTTLMSAPAAARAAENTKLAAITFDDGPGPYTDELLDGLKELGAHATFFVLGSRAGVYTEIVERITQEGHQLGNHSYSHADLNKLSVDAALKEMTGTDGILYDLAGGGSPFCYRVPYGNSTAALREKLGSPVVLWSVDTLDWKYKDAAQVEKNIKEDIKDGSIILLHDIFSTSVQGALAAIEDLQKEGYEFVTVNELYRRRGAAMEAGMAYYSCPNGGDLGSIPQPEITSRAVEGGREITITGPEGVPIYYTSDGSPIGFDAQKYTGPFTVQEPCTVRAVAAVNLNGSRSGEAEAQFDRPQAFSPAISLEGGKLEFKTAGDGESVYFRVGESGPYRQAQGAAAVKSGSYVCFYAQGENTDPSPVEKVWVSERGTLMADISPDKWYYEAMDLAAQLGYIEPDKSNRYYPDSTISRGELAQIIYRAQGKPGVSGEVPYEDVKSGTEQAKAILWGSRQGIFEGYGDGTFRPDSPLERQELAKILSIWLKVRGVDSEQQDGGAEYLDWAEVSQWARPWVEKMTSMGILEGSGGYFDPRGTLTAAQAVTAVLRCVETVQN